MQKLTNVLDNYNLTGRILAGMDTLVGEDRALDAFEILETKWRFEINRRATGRTGLCISYAGGRGEINISFVLLQEGNEATRDNTILHEVAHAVDKILNGKTSGHGTNWKRIMKAFGCKTDRCMTDQKVNQDMHEVKLRRAKIMYKCRRCEHEFPAQRRKKHPVECYRHNGCGGQLYLQRDAMGRTHPNPGANTHYGA